MRCGNQCRHLRLHVFLGTSTRLRAKLLALDAWRSRPAMHLDVVVLGLCTQFCPLLSKPCCILQVHCIAQRLIRKIHRKGRNLAQHAGTGFLQYASVLGRLGSFPYLGVKMGGVRRLRFHFAWSQMLQSAGRRHALSVLAFWGDGLRALVALCPGQVAFTVPSPPRAAFAALGAFAYIRGCHAALRFTQSCLAPHRRQLMSNAGIGIGCAGLATACASLWW